MQGMITAGAMLPLAACVQASANGVVVSEQASFKVEKLVDGLAHPWAMAFLPDGDILITERPGLLRRVHDGKLDPTPIAGTPEVYVKGQGGLLDVALDPDYAENGWLYLSYAGVDEGNVSGTHVARARLDDGGLADLEVIFRSNTQSRGSVHWGSRLRFGPDGYLYVTVGERGDGDNAQDLGRHAGSVLRLNPDGSVPEDNPFVGQEGAMPEIWSYGHRNPQGLAVRPETGEVFAQEHGPKGGDEINIVQPGANYGWPLVSWGIDYGGSPIGDGSRERDGTVQPIHYWDPSIAPSGMTFYDGDAFPEWQGDLLVGALKFQLIARLELDGDRVVGEERLIQYQIGRIRDVRTGPDGFVYLLTDDPSGGLFRLVPAEG
jgi:glucose/arabinose dehydrogenase